MICSGLHCAGCAGGMAVPVLPAIACLGAAWVAEHLVEVAIVSAACGTLAVAVVIALMRWCDRRERRHMAGRPLLVTRPAPATLTATVIPQVSQPERPAIPQVVNFNFYGTGGTMAARVIRQAIPDRPGSSVTKGE